MPNRSHRSTQGRLPQRYKDFAIEMSNSSKSPIRDNDGCGSSSEEASANNTIVNQQDDNNEMVNCLMERLRVLEENNQRTMQQLLQSEAKRSQLQEQLLIRDAALELPTSAVVVDTSVGVATTVQHNATATSTTYYNTFSLGTDNTAVHYSLSQQPIATVTSTPLPGQVTMLPSQKESTQPYSMHAGATVNVPQSNVTYTPTTCRTFVPATSSYVPTYSMYTYTGLPYGANSVTTNTSYMPTFSNVCTQESNNIHLPTRKLYDLPEFHGHPEQWPIFIAAFIESSNAYRYTDLENTFRLQRCLKGSAREDIECLLINPRNVSQIIEQLEFKYGRPELLIRSQLQKVREIMAIPESHLEKLIPFATKVQNLTTFLKSCNAMQHLCNPTLMEELILKLPMSKRIEWASYSSAIDPYPSLEHFNDWLKRMSRVIAKVTPNLPSTSFNNSTKNNMGQFRQNTKNILTVVEQDVDKAGCVKCKKPHSLSECGQFLKLSVNERWTFVKNSHLCFSCLRKGHTLVQCRRKRVCNVNGCKKIHNANLHEELIHHQAQVNVIDQSPLAIETSRLLYKIVPVELRGPSGNIVRTYAFLDEGSSSTIIQESLARQLGCKQKMEPLTLRWFKGELTTVMSMNVRLEIKGIKRNKRWRQLRARSVPELDLPTQSVSLKELHDRFKHLKDLPINEYFTVIPQVLIGLDNCHLTPNMKSVRLSQCVMAANTPLGWVIYGRMGESKGTSSCQLSFILHTREENEHCLEKLVSDYFTTENFGVQLTKKQLEPENIKRAKRILKYTTRRVDNHYETGLLWRNDDVELPDSHNMALSRLISLERKMKNDKKFADAYKKSMNNYILNGYARKLSSDEVAKTSPRKWYLPHFAVFNINKPGKLRLVFDAAASVNGISLNTNLLKGPDENQSLIKILFQFREGSIGVCADIKEMFLQVHIQEADQNVQRFLWRFDRNEPVETYAMVSMVFGATCSPCSAQYVKNLNAMNNAKNQPDVISAILNNHYVDDMVCSFRNEEDALRISTEIKRTHAKASFDLRGFISNSPCVQQELNGTAKNNVTNVNMNSADSVEKVLGMYWKSSRDEFIFELHMYRVDPAIMSGAKRPTKRELLSLVMSVYDPFGMLADLLLYGKIFLQELWRIGLGWDEEIPLNTYQRFAQWVQSLQKVREFRMPRCYNRQLFDSGTSIELHIFNDASEIAFASVAYWRINAGGKVYVCFIAGKTKCAPTKVLSIPRLELQAALLGTRLKNMIMECHRVQPTRTIFWTDSKTVISWIKADHRQYKPFVMHRVGEILESSNEHEWRWVPTNLNAADIATRTNYPINYSPGNIWTQGPTFLLEDEQTWPQPIVCNTTSVNEERRNYCMVASEECLIDFSRFSSYLRLRRTVAWVMRFQNLCRKRVEVKQVYELTIDELERAEIKICQLIQRETYAKEIDDLKSTGFVSKHSPILSLTPQLNGDGLLCVYGRVDYAIRLPELTKHPIILPNRHIVTELLVMWYHQRLFHQNEELVVNEIRRKFWVIHLRAAVKRVKSKCQQCRNDRAKPRHPMMGQLPIDRLQPYVRPFTYTGLDYFGPMHVTVGRRREKRWAALFTCLTIRAIHIELVSDLSTDACIIAIRNFVNRRGVPIKIRSDMGTNFVGADKELKRVDDLFDHNYIQSELATRNILWEFNCPANPSSGGCWERLIQSTKKVLAVTLKEIAPKVETLRSLLIEAENIVNSRPLTHLPVTPENPDPLTPNHFLLGTTNSTQTPCDSEPICTRKQYRIGQQLKNRFWQRWIREYLPTLTKRTKWFTHQEPIKINDVVIICDENQPRSNWRRGVVVKRLTAKDGVTRVVEVRTSNGVLRRPVTKLAVLDVCGEVSSDCHEGGNVAVGK